MPKHPVRCNRCRHYYITWDIRFPRGCRAMGFKGKQLPETTVLTSSGTPCLKFEPKQPRDGDPSGKKM